MSYHRKRPAGETPLHRAACAWLALALGCAAPALAAQARVAPVRVFVFTSQDGPDLKNRTESVKQVREDVAGRYQKLQIVASAAVTSADADVTVRVLSREVSARDGDHIAIHMLVTSGTLAVAIDGNNDEGEWDEAGSDAAEKLRAWISTNRDAIASRAAAR